MTYDRRTFSTGLASVALCATFSRTAQAQQVERPSLTLGVANKAHLYYLPLTLTERRGHFKEYGLTITTADFEGGGQSLEALLAGSVDVTTGEEADNDARTQRKRGQNAKLEWLRVDRENGCEREPFTRNACAEGRNGDCDGAQGRGRAYRAVSGLPLIRDPRR